MSLRIRLSLVALLATAVVFAAGSILFSNLLSSNLVDTLDANLAAQASQASQTIPEPGGQENFQDVGGAPVGASSPHGPGVPSEYLVQVLAPGGRLAQASQAAGDLTLLTPAEVRQAARSTLRLTVTRAGGQLRLLAIPVADQRGWVVVVGASLATIEETLHNVDLALVVAGIVGVLLVAIAAYLLARAALSPVEAMRREVEALAAEQRPSGAGIEVPSTNDELARLGETMNDLLARLSGSFGQLSDALARERAFVADAGHELRTPLAVLRGELELAAREGRTPAELASAVHSALGEADHIARLAEDLLVLAQRDSGELSCVPEQVALGSLLQRCADVVAPAAERAGVSVIVEVDPGLEGLLDPGRLRQVIENLLDNALRHAPCGSVVTISARARATTLALGVADEGPGFSPAFLPRAFERFARADAARSRATGGTGLGLAIVAAIAAAHGGRASAANRPSGGAVIAVEVPDAVILPPPSSG